MENFVSNVKQPLKFFEDLIIEGGYEEFRSNFFLGWEKSDPMGAFVRFYEDEDYVVHDFQYMIDDSKLEDPRSYENLPVQKVPPISLYDEVSINENINDWKYNGVSIVVDKRKRVNLKDVLTLRIKKEELISQRLILQAVSEITFNGNSTEFFLKHHVDLLKQLTQKNKLLLQQYPVCKESLNSILAFISELLPSKLSKEEIKQVANNRTIQEDTDPILQILGFLNGKDDDGNQIMSSDEYERLLSAIRYIATNKTAPKSTKKFNIPIPVGELKYAFYLILPFVKGAKDVFLQFLLDNIVEFKEWSFDSFKTKISEPPTYLHDYLPPVFHEKKMKQINKNK